ncbi:MAG: GMC family oxidoreductase N-terminal domain-containing protein [Flavobacteriaceae bacterium]|nr:GMC family oxidoreductase N-terminal domain-containing protein [Flavobacteriaceae bacterium]
MNHTLEFDIVVIGSGVGGATFTDYLTRKHKNLKIAILESGPNRTKEQFTQSEIDMTAFYFNNGAVLSKNLQIGVAAAKTLGGSSSVYTGVSFRPPKSILDDWRENHGLNFLSDGYVSSSLDEIETDLSIHELPKSWDNENNLIFQKGAAELGIPVKRLKINSKNCKQQGFCNLGCPTGAKQGALEVQIPRILKRHVKIFCNTEVQAVAENKVNAIVKEAPQNTIANTIENGEYLFKAKKIIIAAGVLNTPVILLRSAKKLGLKNKNIGRYLTLHPVFNVNGILKKSISNYSGFPKTVYSDYFSETDGFLLETSFYYPGITAKNNPSYGILHQDAMSDYDKMMSILILAHDKAEFKNRITINKKGERILDYTLSEQSKKSLVKALQESAKLFFAAGCVKTLLPASKKLPLIKTDVDKIDELISEKYLNLNKTPLSSAHPQGGARMGSDSENSVCNIYGKVYGTKSIYVCDASLFPTSVKVNPYETIMLLAKWVAENMFN